jgi:hypothetical protein
MTRIRGHKTKFIDADSLRPRQRGFQLQSEFGRFGFSGGKCMYKSAELFFGDGSKELDTGEARSGEQLRKLFFRWRSFQRHTIQ